jgi:hypothetical protein
MVGFRNVAAYAAAEEAGRTHFCSLRKVPSQASVAGHWVDLSMAAGNPKPQYYAAAPLVSQVLDGFDGIFHGDAKAPASKHLTDIGLMTASAGLVGQYTLLDYLLYYSFVDGDDLGTQVLTTGVTLPRYASGEGVMVMAVVVAPTAGGGSFTFDYIDSDGVARTSGLIACNTTATGIASLLTSEASVGGRVFLPLAAGSRGVRSITGVTMASASGGLFALVLVHPIASTAIREINTPAEVNFVVMKPEAPRIEDGAYLGLIMNCASTVAAAALAGYAKFNWSA